MARTLAVARELTKMDKSNTPEDTTRETTPRRSARQHEKKNQQQNHITPKKASPTTAPATDDANTTAPQKFTTPQKPDMPTKGHAQDKANNVDASKTKVRTDEKDSDGDSGESNNNQSTSQKKASQKKSNAKKRKNTGATTTKAAKKPKTADKKNAGKKSETKTHAKQQQNISNIPNLDDAGYVLSNALEVASVDIDNNAKEDLGKDVTLEQATAFRRIQYLKDTNKKAYRDKIEEFMTKLPGCRPNAKNIAYVNTNLKADEDGNYTTTGTAMTKAERVATNGVKWKCPEEYTPETCEVHVLDPLKSNKLACQWCLNHRPDEYMPGYTIITFPNHLKLCPGVNQNRNVVQKNLSKKEHQMVKCLQNKKANDDAKMTPKEFDEYIKQQKVALEKKHAAYYAAQKLD